MEQIAKNNITWSTGMNFSPTLVTLMSKVFRKNMPISLESYEHLDILKRFFFPKLLGVKTYHVSISILLLSSDDTNMLDI